MKIKIIYCFLISLFVTEICSQTYENDILDIYKKLRSAAKYSMTLEYNLYVDKNLSQPYQTRNIDLKRDNNNIHIIQKNGIEIIDNPKHQLFIDNENKIITAIEKHEDKEASESLTIINEYFQTYVDTMMQVFDKINVLSSNATQVKYECIYKTNPKVSKMIVTINKKIPMFESVLTIYKEPREIKKIDDKKHTISVEVKYKLFNATPSFNGAVFNSSNYITIGKSGKISLANKYNNFELITTN